jgi:hypothetical protein
MTRQYKSKFEELSDQLLKLGKRQIDNNQTIEELKEQYERLNNDKNEIER